MATQREVSEHLGLSVASISELIKKGVLPAKRGRSPLDIDVCRHSYIGYLRKLAGYHKKVDQETLQRKKQDLQRLKQIKQS